MPNFGSLFSGIGLTDLGIERAGMTCRWMVEIDPFCQKVLRKHWPTIDLYEDVRYVGQKQLKPIDLISGGFPCQPHSVIGKRKASNDERDLWPDYNRIVGELRPRWVLAENTPGILSSEGGRYFLRLLSDLSTNGYDAEWATVSAYAVGAPHLRDRVWIVARRRDSDMGSGGDAGPGIFTSTFWDGLLCQWRLNRHDPERWDDRLFPHRVDTPGPLAHPGSQGLEEWGLDPLRREVVTTGRGGQWATEPGMGRMVDGGPDRVDRVRALGNAAVPLVAEMITRRILEIDASLA